MESVQAQPASPAAPEPARPRKSRGRPPAGGSPASTDEIMAAALRIFARDGFAGASVAEINRELGVSHNLIHQRFGSKEGLWFAVVDWVFGHAAALVAEGAAAELPPLEEFRRGIVRFLILQADYPDAVRLVSMESAIEGPRLAYLYERHIEPILMRLAEPLLPLVRRKVLSRNDLRSIHFLIAHGATAPFSALPLARRMAPGDPLSAQAVRRHARFVADMIVAGVQARAAAHRDGEAADEQGEPAGPRSAEDERSRR
ncbi:TetR/AcrR family transcriptional regulator [Nocardia higoensis]|uniref:TetR/AcrR family transcriptional regulator n=1 Tax=Nocardia higoensis TaxID=228599 RepID=UPI001FE233FF|nr:TetR family transcriptional regulator [Nocardia higoensis]